MVFQLRNLGLNHKGCRPLWFAPGIVLEDPNLLEKRTIIFYQYINIEPYWTLQYLQSENGSPSALGRKLKVKVCENDH